MWSRHGLMTNLCPGYTTCFLTWFNYYGEISARHSDPFVQLHLHPDTHLFISLPGWVKILWQPFWRALKKQLCQDSTLNLLINQSQQIAVTNIASETLKAILRKLVLNRKPQKSQSIFQPGLNLLGLLFIAATVIGTLSAPPVILQECKSRLFCPL